MKSIKKVGKVALPIAAAVGAPYLAPALGVTSALGTAGVGAGLGAIGGAVGGGGLKGALKGAALSGAGSLLSSGLSGNGLLSKAVGSPGEVIKWNQGGSTVVGGSGLSGAANKISNGLSSLTGSGSGGSPSILNTASTIYSGVNSSNTQDKMKKQLLEAQGRSLDAVNPYLSSGKAANKMLSSKLQSGELGGEFTPEDLTQDPGYQFRLQEGTKSMNRSLGAQGNLFSGAALKAAQEYGQGLADQTYNDAYRRWIENQGLNYDMLAGQSNQGLNAANMATGIYDNQGNINANATLQKSNIFNDTLSRLMGSGAKKLIGYDANNQPIYA